MFQYNKPCKTITGEIVTPYTKEGNKILCFNSKGETVYKEVKDFKVIENTEQKTIVAIPKEKPIKIKEQEKIVEVTFQEEKPIEKKPRKKRIKKEKPIEKKKVVVSSKEEQKIVKQDMFKEEIIENYKGNNIEEEYI